MAQNSVVTKQRGPGRPFETGISGNPGGRPAIPPEVIALARSHTAAAITALAANLSDENGNVRNTAAQALLDRAWGRSREHVEVVDANRVDPYLAALVALARPQTTMG